MAYRRPESGGTRVLRGRRTESALLESVVSAVREGESRTLLLLGEAGVGKTALLQHLIAAAADLQIARAVGVESEMELAFAGLHQLPPARSRSLPGDSSPSPSGWSLPPARPAKSCEACPNSRSTD